MNPDNPQTADRPAGNKGKGEAGKPNKFGKLVQLREAENQIITHYEIYDEPGTSGYC